MQISSWDIDSRKYLKARTIEQGRGGYVAGARPHCSRCLVNPVRGDDRLCVPCAFKQQRRVNSAKRAAWQGDRWPDNA